MADIRTLKQGRLYQVVGDARSLFNEGGGTHVYHPAAFVDNNGLWTLLYLNAGFDVFRKTGNHLLTMSTASGSIVINEAQAVGHLCPLQDGATTRLWYSLDNGAGLHAVMYRTSADGGATWSASSNVIALGGGGTWNDEQVRPVGVYKDAIANRYYLFCMGYDGAAWKLGRWEATIGSDLSLLASWTAYGSNPIYPTTGTMGPYAALVFADERYWLVYGDDIGPTEVHWSASNDGLGWTHQAQLSPKVFTIGISTTLDDVELRPSNMVVAEGLVWLTYHANDGSQWRAFAAVGQKPKRLWKVPGLNNTTSSEKLEVYEALGDLAFSTEREHVHIPLRGDLHVLVEGPFVPCRGSFGMRYVQFGAGGVGALSPAPNIFKQFINPGQAVNQGPTFDTHFPKPHNLLYDALNGSGTQESFFWFPRVVIDEIRLAEAANGDRLNLPFTCHGLNRPVMGRY